MCCCLWKSFRPEQRLILYRCMMAGNARLLNTDRLYSGNVSPFENADRLRMRHHKRDSINKRVRRIVQYWKLPHLWAVESYPDYAGFCDNTSQSGPPILFDIFQLPYEKIIWTWIEPTLVYVIPLHLQDIDVFEIREIDTTLPKLGLGPGA